VEWDGLLSLSGTIKETLKKAMKKILCLLLFAAGILNTAPVCIGAQTLYPVVVNGRWGFVNKSGETVINPQFDHAGGFMEGLAPVRMGRWGYVDGSGKIAVVPQFDKADVFSEGLAAIKLGGGGDPFVPYDPRPFYHVGGGGRYGYINTDGKYAINPQFEDAGAFSGGLAPVRMGGHWGFVDKTGIVVINPQFERAQQFSEGLAGIRAGGKWGFVDRTGKMTINSQFDDVGRFGKGLAPVRQGKHWGYIDPAGKFVINPQFDEAGAFSEGLAPVKQGKHWGFITLPGNLRSTRSLTTLNPLWTAWRWSKRTGNSATSTPAASTPIIPPSKPAEVSALLAY